MAGAFRPPGGSQRGPVEVAQQGFEAFAQLAQKTNTLIVPANLSEVAGLIGAAMALTKSPVLRPGDARVPGMRPGETSR